MSQPEQDLTRQVRRHRGPIFGIVIVVLLVVGFFLWWVGYEVDGAGPTSSAEQTEGQVSPTAPAPSAAPDQPGGAPAPSTAAP